MSGLKKAVLWKDCITHGAQFFLWCKSILSKVIPASSQALISQMYIERHHHLPVNSYAWQHPEAPLTGLQVSAVAEEGREKKEKKVTTNLDYAYICIARYLEWHRLPIIYTWTQQTCTGNVTQVLARLWSNNIYVDITNTTSICNSTMATEITASDESMELNFVTFVSFFQGAQLLKWSSHNIS